MKKYHLVTKSIWTIFLVVVEIATVTSLLVYASQFLKPFQDKFDMVERYIIFFAAYEISIYTILNFLNDAKRDSLLAQKTAFEQALLYLESGVAFLKQDLLEKIERQLDIDTLTSLDIRKRYENLIQYIENQNFWAIKYELLMINHSYEMCDLQWRFTFLLRLFK
ncbi:MAG: hypothetical protein ACT6FF_08615 [Methanosarcinaceae archaeon]